MSVHGVAASGAKRPFVVQVPTVEKFGLFAVSFDGGTGTGKNHLAIAIAKSCIRSGARGRF
jgi:DNA replication protein DnaC